ncbi:glycoside hydrolase family 5 protein [Hypoxylon rubiginosum]|uniref:Glycoside hydrolase family 5 protein n=1 Tax=Hypoxylon rubiginosum TaxID=110542 RepID=A0ACB9YPM1_9PEZI|nr:glycoside hydrolase family 5 protein [Hypoxylon rubiginosum]
MMNSGLRSVVSLLALSCSVLSPFSWASPLKTINNDRAASWPFGPLVTSGRDIKNAQGGTVVYAGTNWPGHGEVMIPDGLHYQSIESVITKIKSTGMNAIRLTYAIQMIDDIYSKNGQDTTVRQSFINALGQTNGAKVYSQFLAKNPSFNDSTTRLQVFDAVAAECAKQQVFVHLDNHMSKAAWCCSSNDGNTWFGDTYYNVDNWTRGLSYMANHGKSWTALTSMSLRNELRKPESNPTLSSQSYNWRDWYTNIKKGTSAINSANPDLLIFLSGLDYDTYMTPVVQGTAFTPGSAKYSAADFPNYANKLVLEIHNYQNSASNCNSLKSSLYNSGFQALHAEDSGAKNVFPVLLTEFGFDMSGNAWQGTYATCIASYLAEQKAGWFIWVVSGSYYIRSGTQDFEETWGLLKHDWSGWRSSAYIEGGLKPLAKATAQG